MQPEPAYTIKTWAKSIKTKAVQVSKKEEADQKPLNDMGLLTVTPKAH